MPNPVARMQQLKLSLPAEGLRVRFKPAEQDLPLQKSMALRLQGAVKGKADSMVPARMAICTMRFDSPPAGQNIPEQKGRDHHGEMGMHHLRL